MLSTEGVKRRVGHIRDDFLEADECGDLMVSRT